MGFFLDRSRAIAAVTAVAVFLAGWWVAREWDVEVAVTHRSAIDPGKNGYAPQVPSGSGSQWVMVYIGSSSCPWATDAALPDAIERIKMHLLDQAAERGRALKVVGLSLDPLPEQGIRYLSAFGRFDEISTGYGWGNSLAMKYLWSEGLGDFATPQVLVYERLLIRPGGESGDTYFDESDRRKLLVMVGLQEILRWSESGAAVPRS